MKPDNENNEQTPLSFSQKVLPQLKKFGKAAWEYLKAAKIELLVLVGIVVLDLVTKALIGHFMYVGQSIELIPDFLYITYVRNTKAAFGSAFGLEKVLGDDAIRVIFLIVTVLAVGVFAYLLYRCRKRHFLMRLAIAMIIAGAIGNFVDRLIYAYVRDFIEFVFFGCSLPWLGKSFPVFNVADMGLTIGVILFLIYFIVLYKEPKAPQPAQAESAPQASEAETNTAAESETEHSGETEAPQEERPSETAPKAEEEAAPAEQEEQR